LIRESVLRPADVPSVMHQIVRENRPIEEVAVGDGWHDAGELHAKTIKLRLTTLLGEDVVTAEFHPEPTSTPITNAIPLLPLLYAIVHDTVSARRLKTILQGRLNTRLAASDRFSHEIEAMNLGGQEVAALRNLVASKRIATWLERYPDDEAPYLHLAYLLLEIGLLMEQPDSS